jgi:hypothetical protein
MRIFTTNKRALESVSNKKQLWMNSLCPFKENKLCGNWCAMFFMGKSTAESTPYVILGCKGSDKMLYIDDIIYE